MMQVPAPKPKKRQWKKALGNVIAWTFAAALAIGVVEGMRQAREHDAALRAMKEAEKIAEERAGHELSPEVIDRASVLEYAESQRLKLEVLEGSIDAFKAMRGTVPSGSDWQSKLLEAETLKSEVTLDSFPEDITWNRANMPPPFLEPGLDSTGRVILTLKADGITLAMYHRGEILVTEQPEPPDAARPR